MILAGRASAIIVFGAAVWMAPPAFSGQTPPRDPATPAVWQLTFLKAEPGQRDRLERFITLNWFGPDDTARRRGFISGFQLLRGSEEDSAWDLLVVDIFADADTKAKARERYRAEIIPAHTKQLVDGLDFPALGRIVAERTTTAISGHVEAHRVGLGTPPVSPPQDAMVVERSRAGPVSIGASAEAIYGQFGDRARLIDLKLEGHLSPALEIKLFGSQLVPSVVAEIGAADNKLVVTRIHVVDPSLRTKEGIGVGSTYGDLRSRYPVEWVGSGEGRVVARVETLGISFQLDTSGPVPLWSIRDPGQVPKDVRIVSLMLTR